MPEGILVYDIVLDDLIKRFAANVTRITVLGNMIYSVCCVND